MKDGLITKHPGTGDGVQALHMMRQALFLICVSTILAFGANLLRPDGLELPGDWSVAARLTTPEGESLLISLKDARHLFESGHAVFLDARPPGDFDEGHIQDAVCLPVQEFDAYFADVMDVLEGDKVLITYCDGDACRLSKDLANLLQEMDYPKVKVLHNGWTMWKDAGLPTGGAGAS